MRQIRGYYEYFIEEDGTVYKFKKEQYHQIVASIRGNYKTVHLRRETFYVHHLVVDTFISPKPFPGAIIRHLDGDPLNNHKDNLAWGDAIDDAEDKRKCGTLPVGARNNQSKLIESQVKEILTASCNNWGDSKNLAKKYNVSPATISMIRNKKIWTSVE